MYTSSPEAEHVATFKKLGGQLGKKGLLHRPNYGQLISGWTSLSGAFRREGNHQMAALSHLSVAKCEHALKDNTLEASAYVEAGHCFWSLAFEMHEAGTLSFNENVTEAINCYMLAIEIYASSSPAQKSLAASLYFEIGFNLKKLGRYSEASRYFQCAADLQQFQDEILPAVNSLQSMLGCCILSRDYKTACFVLTWIIKLASEGPDLNDIDNFDSGRQCSTTSTPSSVLVYPALLVEARISLVLLLILQRDLGQARDYISKLPEDAVHTHKGTAQAAPLPQTAHLAITLLQDLVSACEHKDSVALQQIQWELWGMLTPPQNEFLHRIESELFVE
ncbi:factor VIII intron 22 protein [Pelomyxa schiedti]|nr:factor VIII intron 22 protein [Pelomyxa schiedti]